MIHEEICTYEVAKLAKEKGYPQKFNYSKFTPRYNYYNHNGELHGDVSDILKLRLNHEPIPEEMEPITAPTQSLLQRWLREEKGICVAIEAYTTFATKNKLCFGWTIKHNSDGFSIKTIDSDDVFSTYELALEDAELYCLRNLL